MCWVWYVKSWRNRIVGKVVLSGGTRNEFFMLSDHPHYTLQSSTQAVVGTSLSEPHTSVTALSTCV